ncbi:hypothetical protein BLNAU_10854 [Blattamonas nauphoetae]|uniref:Uncharacterized protein n=1 Tax=Blattamonas nauphoetae TaxID=2049346 RepID=A0ABQ9XQX7_9EUKA|nr:hypothetical protein BLNAU_10854 [Blattamonas nauphoetae]
MLDESSQYPTESQERAILKNTKLTKDELTLYFDWFYALMPAHRSIPRYDIFFSGELLCELVGKLSFSEDKDGQEFEMRGIFRRSTTKVTCEKNIEKALSYLWKKSPRVKHMPTATEVPIRTRSKQIFKWMNSILGFYGLSIPPHVSKYSNNEERWNYLRTGTMLCLICFAFLDESTDETNPPLAASLPLSSVFFHPEDEKEMLSNVQIAFAGLKQRGVPVFFQPDIFVRTNCPQFVLLQLDVIYGELRTEMPSQRIIENGRRKDPVDRFDEEWMNARMSLGDWMVFADDLRIPKTTDSGYLDDSDILSPFSLENYFPMEPKTRDVSQVPTPGSIDHSEVQSEKRTPQSSPDHKLAKELAEASAVANGKTRARSQSPPKHTEIQSSPRRNTITKGGTVTFTSQNSNEEPNITTISFADHPPSLPQENQTTSSQSHLLRTMRPQPLQPITSIDTQPLHSSSTQAPQMSATSSFQTSFLLSPSVLLGETKESDPSTPKSHSVTPQPASSRGVTTALPISPSSSTHTHRSLPSRQYTTTSLPNLPPRVPLDSDSGVSVRTGKDSYHPITEPSSYRIQPAVHSPSTTSSSGRPIRTTDNQTTPSQQWSRVTSETPQNIDEIPDPISIYNLNTGKTGSQHPPNDSMLISLDSAHSPIIPDSSFFFHGDHVSLPVRTSLTVGIEGYVPHTEYTSMESQLASGLPSATSTQPFTQFVSPDHSSPPPHSWSQTNQSPGIETANISPNSFEGSDTVPFARHFQSESHGSLTEIIEYSLPLSPTFFRDPSSPPLPISQRGEPSFSFFRTASIGSSSYLHEEYPSMHSRSPSLMSFLVSGHMPTFDSGVHSESPLRPLHNHSEKSSPLIQKLVQSPPVKKHSGQSPTLANSRSKQIPKLELARGLSSDPIGRRKMKTQLMIDVGCQTPTERRSSDSEPIQPMFLTPIEHTQPVSPFNVSSFGSMLSLQPHLARASQSSSSMTPPQTVSGCNTPSYSFLSASHPTPTSPFEPFEKKEKPIPKKELSPPPRPKGAFKRKNLKLDVTPEIPLTPSRHDGQEDKVKLMRMVDYLTLTPTKTKEVIFTEPDTDITMKQRDDHHSHTLHIKHDHTSHLPITSQRYPTVGLALPPTPHKTRPTTHSEPSETTSQSLPSMNMLKRREMEEDMKKNQITPEPSPKDPKNDKMLGYGWDKSPGEADDSADRLSKKKSHSSGENESFPQSLRSDDPSPGFSSIGSPTLPSIESTSDRSFSSEEKDGSNDEQSPNEEQEEKDSRSMEDQIVLIASSQSEMPNQEQNSSLDEIRGHGNLRQRSHSAEGRGANELDENQSSSTKELTGQGSPAVVRHDSDSSVHPKTVSGVRREDEKKRKKTKEQRKRKERLEQGSVERRKEEERRREEERKREEEKAENERKEEEKRLEDEKIERRKKRNDKGEGEEKGQDVGRAKKHSKKRNKDESKTEENDQPPILKPKPVLKYFIRLIIPNSLKVPSSLRSLIDNLRKNPPKPSEELDNEDIVSVEEDEMGVLLPAVLFLNSTGKMWIETSPDANGSKGTKICTVRLADFDGSEVSSDDPSIILLHSSTSILLSGTQTPLLSLAIQFCSVTAALSFDADFSSFR